MVKSNFPKSRPNFGKPKVNFNFPKSYQSQLYKPPRIGGYPVNLKPVKIPRSQHPARRRQSGGGEIITLVFIVLFVAASGFVTFSVYVGFPSLLVGLSYFYFSSKKKPSGFSSEQLTTLNSHREELMQLLQRKRSVYAEGDRLKLQRRSDNRRFDERAHDSRPLNRELDDLDQKLVDTWGNFQALKQFLLSELNQWRLFSAGAVAFFTALLAYIFTFLMFLTIEPEWLNELSKKLSEILWFRESYSQIFYGELVVSYVVSIVVISTVWPLTYKKKEWRISTLKEQYSNTDSWSKEYFTNWVPSTDSQSSKLLMEDRGQA
jgi:hypothetical protein